MSRKKSYDLGEVLNQLTMVFWQHGYQSTSMRMLEEATGLDRRSLFNEFESKEGMFRRSLAHYLDIKAKPEGAPLGRTPPGAANIRRFFENIRYQEGHEWGCLLTLTMLEKESVPEDAYEIARATYQGLEDAFFMNLIPAVQDGRLESKRAARTLAQYFLNGLFGIIVQGRAGATNRQLKSLVRVLLTPLPQ